MATYPEMNNNGVSYEYHQHNQEAAEGAYHHPGTPRHGNRAPRTMVENVRDEGVYDPHHDHQMEAGETFQGSDDELQFGSGGLGEVERITQLAEQKLQEVLEAKRDITLGLHESLVLFLQEADQIHHELVQISSAVSTEATRIQQLQPQIQTATRSISAATNGGGVAYNNGE
ncbi:expressed unknown protein [Seminavis robusta]|uniref:Uncharacterized protein n=1 Tax=Seminavis robusta TaxID=568900 RepID=A0A9N8E3B4_9STRA|nr:expressed unknown protein [Seminavis robusta]|eukprot:Sro575_g169300.1 n/a (172) ;mRNA; r:13479-14085